MASGINRRRVLAIDHPHGPHRHRLAIDRLVGTESLIA